MSLNIQTANREDLSLLIQLYADMDGETPLAKEKAEEIWDAITKTPNYQIYLAFQNQAPVGTFSLVYIPTMLNRGYHKFAVLDAVTVTSKLRGQGIGSEMIKAAIQICADAGCYKVILSSNLQREKAHQFYKKLGFEQHGWSFKCVVGK
ncbi:GNAT family N-acetyltransferase [Anabaena cylindrica FACHB-243]|uniref:GCN5-related N-acetyltransferase n=1 Tax=Anabaena cylindrica (strain ATCC 27899 / PCC 7122) TaxID=272123 RepID=K9ZJR3_ANACC|nr:MULTISPECIES: GNAT family N-acetyltransferase [Anabaena]AFZ58575.1 GCN5-related N-acetyltransferase [Anabaena cylindrica PCC 7122]MBD2416337.1 GNAT family N-acetyltransferase [Anabaena cylindrica FACHB-243]MBY5283893.1 GNAT family N-acetyltransferase [Anabaena sp. CCAP 1446/1C]MBY5311079.1 GNAT family N-acetyltransferase [Anabaena sp. CCAP 1446/1C]MCM2407282.1 GNAT family N-acetyltransferase [Anabaena sp. CCAP 1446/1C]